MPLSHASTGRIAARHGQSRAAEALLQAGADPNCSDSFSFSFRSEQSALECARQAGHDWLAAFLSRTTPAPAAKPPTIRDAAERGDLVKLRAAIEAVWEAGGNVESELDCVNASKRFVQGHQYGGNGYDGLIYTPLQAAAFHGHRAVLTELLHTGARVGVVDNQGRTALLLAARNGHVACVNALIAAGESVHQVDSTDYGNSALVLAAMSGHKEVVKVLIQKGVRQNSTWHSSWDPAYIALLYAAMQGHSAVVKLLLQTDVQFDKANLTGSRDWAWLKYLLILSIGGGHPCYWQLPMDRPVACWR